MKEGGSKKAALILMKNSHFDRTLRYVYNIMQKEVYLPMATEMAQHAILPAVMVLSL